MSVRIGAAAVCGFVAALALGGVAQADCKVGRIAELPVTMRDMQPMVPVKINGVPVQMVVDSGAFFSSLSPSIASEQNLPKFPMPYGMTVTGVGGETAPYLTHVKVFTLANVDLKNREFIVMAGSGGADSVGLLGANVLGIADVEYDFAHGAVRLMEAHDCGRYALVYWEPGKAYSTVEIEGTNVGYNTHTIGSAYVNGARIHVQFDTGAGTSMMTRAAAKRAGINLDDPAVKPGGASWGIGRRMIRTWIVPVASIKIGDEEIRNTKIRVGDFDLMESDMLLGADFFQSHRVYVANSQHKLYFTYNGGPVFNLDAHTLEQDARSGTIKESEVAAPDGPDPTDAAGFGRRGAALASRREYVKAIADFDRACAMDPKEPSYFYQRGMAHWQNKQPFLAMSDFDAALKLKPGDIDTLVARAELKLQGNDKDSAAQDLDAAAAAVPNQADVRLRLAQLYDAADRLAAAIGQYDLWIPSHSDEALLSEGLNDRCWARTLLGRDLDQALKDCDRALRLRPKTAGFLDSRGLVHLRLGEFDKAVADYDAALAISPKMAWSLYGRGLAKQHLGQQAEGQKDIDAAVALQADLPKKAKGYGIVAPATVAAK
ncbi:retroviral-like aspartic protease family protein [Phenylobacterium montanum]|uniref:Retroviral-like aspartic protease family protein n=1 Tax=Phenylobacterium montanum TaxID=2823693 RepID=A0A975FVC7_9CAUL|nr:retroviral-like aspartic protease family protein [Caulobacter sp. S6]QUD86075.1 retroviral-like aspartic protease family protein [Caulobacter sp. S6]